MVDRLENRHAESWEEGTQKRGEKTQVQLKKGAWGKQRQTQLPVPATLPPHFMPALVSGFPRLPNIHPCRNPVHVADEQWHSKSDNGPCLVERVRRHSLPTENKHLNTAGFMAF